MAMFEDYPMAGRGGFVGPMPGNFPAAPSARGAFPAAPSPMQSGANAFMQAADRGGMTPSGGGGSNPFAAIAGGTGARPPLLGPDAPGVFGLIGRLTGAPTRAEWQQQQAGGARATGISQFQQMIASGRSPQEALIEFVQTPEGMDMLAKDPDALRQLVTSAAAVTPEKPEEYTLSPGEARFQGNKQIAALDPSDVQEFNAFAEISNLPPEAVEELAAAKLAATGGDGTQQERAWGRMVAQGLVSPETADAALAGAIEVVDIRDRLGNVTGKAFYDRRDGTMTPLGGGGGVPARPQPGDAEWAPGLGDDPAVPERTSSVPADIVFGAGVVPRLLEAGGGVLGAVHPKFSARETALRRGYLQRIRTDAQNYRSAIGEDRSFARDAELIDDMVNQLGSFTNPGYAFDALMQLHDFVDSRMERDIVILNDESRTSDVRQAADDRLSTLERIKTSLPAREALLEIEDEVANYSVFNDLASDRDNLENEFGVDLPDMPGENRPARAPAAPMEFGSTEDLNEAFLAGEVTFGDTVTVNGQTFRLRQPTEDEPVPPAQEQNRPAASNPRQRRAMQNRSQ